MSKKKDKDSPIIYGYCRVSTAQQNLERQIDNIRSAYPEAVIFQDEYTGTKMDRPQWSTLFKALKSGDTVVFDSVSRMSRNADDGFTAYQNLYERGVSLVFLKEPYINTEEYRSAMSHSIKAFSTGNKITDKLLHGITDVLNDFMMDKVKQDIKRAFEQAEKEVLDTRQRVKEGIAERQRNNQRLKALHPNDFKEQATYKQIGREKGDTLTIKKSAPIKKLIRQLSKDFDGNNTDKEVLAILPTKTVEIPITKKSGKIETRKISAHLSRNTYFKYKREMKQEAAAD